MFQRFIRFDEKLVFHILYISIKYEIFIHSIPKKMNFFNVFHGDECRSEKLIFLRTPTVVLRKIGLRFRQRLRSNC
jgi:hypothetical protein